MIAGLEPAQITERLGRFLTQTKTRSHGRMINHTDAVAAGLNISLLDLHSQVWNDLWELFVRSDWAVTNICNKIIETRMSSVRA